MHHSSHTDSETIRKMMKEMPEAGATADDLMAAESREMDLGATGKFPEGKLDATDEGEIQLAVGRHDGKVVLNFGKPVAWIGFGAAQALELARSLTHHANVLKRREG